MHGHASALVISLFFKQNKVVRLLLEARAIMDGGLHPPIYCAARASNSEGVRLLCEASCNIHARDLHLSLQPTSSLLHTFEEGKADKASRTALKVFIRLLYVHVEVHQNHNIIVYNILLFYYHYYMLFKCHMMSHP